MLEILKKSPVTVYLADDKTIEKKASDYERCYTKEILVKKVGPVYKFLEGRNVIYRTRDGVIRDPDSVMEYYVGKNPKRKFYQMVKREMAWILAAFESVPENYKMLIDTFPPMIMKLAMDIARHGVVSGETAESICGEGVLRKDRKTWSLRDSFVLSKHYDDYFNIWHDYDNVNNYGYYVGYSGNAYIANPYEWLPLLIPMAFPESEETIISRQRENPGKGCIVSNLNNISHALKVLQTMINTGGIEIGTSKLLTKVAERKVAETLKFTDIYVGPFPEYYNQSVATILALCSFVNRKYRTSSSRSVEEESMADVADTVKSIFSKLNAIKEDPQLISTILPHISKITKTTLNNSSVSTYISQLLELLFVDNTWKAVSDIDRQICLYNSGDRNLGLFRLCGFSSFPWRDERNGRIITPDKAREIITFPFIRGFMHLLMSLGIVDLYAEPEEKGGLPFSGIMFVRPTALGLYAAGKGNKPELVENDEYICQYDLIDRPLLVVSKKEGNPYDAWLGKIATKQGNRWIVTPGSFMKECKKEGDVESIVRDFKKFICKQPSSVWIDFFKRMERNIGSGVCQIIGKVYTVYRLNPENKELIEYISRTPEIASIAIRAEDYKLVVSRQNLDRFVELMRRGGFIVE